ncbi:MAG: helicase-related protein, partial [Firmicutes bacterium]|nr:helicase-related protein [Bacillota bacterium]
ECVNGTVPRARRTEILDLMREGSVRCLTATKLADEGLDVPELAAVILATPTRDSNRTRQRVGRIMRPSPDKQPPVVYDLVDAWVPSLASQARTRFFECYLEVAHSPALPDWLKTKRHPTTREPCGE